MTFHSLYKTPWKIKRTCKREKLYILVHFMTRYPCFLNKGPLFSFLHWALPEWAVSAAFGKWPVSCPAGHFYLSPLAGPWLSTGGDLHCGTGNIWKSNHKEWIWLHIESVSFSLTFAFYCFCYKLRILPTVWNIQDGLFWRLWPLKV